MKELIQCNDGKTRCSFRIDDPIYQNYHDTQFGRPTRDDRIIFLKISIEAFASGLSFHGMLAKKEAFEAAFENFDTHKIAAFGEDDVSRLMKNKDIVRNESKIRAIINNAQSTKKIVEDHGSLAAFIWQYEPDPETRPKVINYQSVKENTQSEYSEKLAKDLKSYGFKFVGPVSVYGVFQGCGLINDHFEGCDFREECLEDRRNFTIPEPK